jgi:4-amino-4-deoxychorismate lyase
MSIQIPLISVNGKLGAGISPLDRGFAYGDGLFESCRLLSGCLPLWRYHLERLRTGCERLLIPLDEEQLSSCVVALLAEGEARGLDTGTLKITVTRGEGGRGYRLPPQVLPTICVGLYPAAPDTGASDTGVAVRVCRQRLASSTALAGIKHLNRLEHILARAEWQDDSFAEGLLLDEAGRVVEGTVSNLFIVRAGRLATPDMSLCGVEGVMRRVVMERLAPALQVPVEVHELTLAEVSLADELFLCNSCYGIWPVVALDTEEPGVEPREWQPGPVTRALQAQLTLVWQQGLPENDDSLEASAQ